MSDLRRQLDSLNVSKLKMKNWNTIEKELKRHARILTDCIMHELDNVYDSYEPTVYKRTYGLYNSLYIDDTIRVDISGKNMSLCIGLSFDDGAIHQGFNGEYVNTAILLNDGYKTHGSFSNIPYFGYREGTHFIEKGIQKYKRIVSNPFTVRLTLNYEIREF